LRVVSHELEGNAWLEPTFADVVAAAARIRPHLASTPLRRSPPVSDAVGADVYLKHEFHLPTGAFKVRGGINLISQLNDSEREVGVIAASTGNHGQSVAYAARLFGVKAIICAPENANPAKVEAMHDLGATVRLVGADFDEAREACEQLAAEHGYRYVHSGNEPLLIAGVGTHTLEILSEAPEIDVIIVSDDAISAAVYFLLGRNRTLVEGAGAAALAAAFALKERLAGLRVALILSGGNISIPQLKTILDRG